MVSLQGGHFVPIPFGDLLDPVTGRARVRMVDTRSTRYAIARRYMIRLRRDDFENPDRLARFAATAGITVERFREELAYLVEDEPPPLDFSSSQGGAQRLRGADTPIEARRSERAS